MPLSPRRERLAWAASTVIIALLALRLPGSLASRDDDYAFVRTLVDIRRHLAVSYVEKLDDEQLRERAIAGMLSDLDPYTVYVPPRDEQAFNQNIEGTFLGVGIQLRPPTPPGREVTIETPMENSPALRAGVKSGDVILKVNGEDVVGQTIDQLRSRILGPAGTPVTLTLRRLTGQTLELTMNRESFIVPTVRGYERNADDTWNYFPPQPQAGGQRIAYVRITQFTPETADKLEALLKKLLAEGMKGLVLDLRDNPGGLLESAVEIADLFLEGGVIVSTRGRSQPERVVRASAENTLPDFPLAVLVNGQSASASEILAGALSDNRRATVVGTRSFGKGSVQEIYKLDGKAGELKLTVAHYYLPSGKLVHRKKDSTTWGVDPDIAVPLDPPTEAALLEARLDAENFAPPVPPTVATTRPNDPQLTQALKSLTALLLLDNRPAPATRP